MYVYVYVYVCRREGGRDKAWEDEEESKTRGREVVWEAMGRKR